MSMNVSRTVINTLVKTSNKGVRSYSGQVIPRNIAEINDSHIGMASIDRIRDICSRSQEVAVSQSNRIFSSRFLADQTTSTGQLGEEGQQASFLDLPLDQQLPVQAWIMAYDLSNINIEMKTNVPEPFKAEESVEDTVEGVPAGLSDAKVNLETRSNMDTRLGLDLQMKDTYNLV